MAEQADEADQRMVRAVKQSLLPLFRTHPYIVDSLFTQVVEPKILGAQPSANPQKQVDVFKKQGYRLLTQLYREPRTIKHIGPDIPLPYPDSLRSRSVGGAVRIQAYLGADGLPRAMEVIEGVHPVLDAIALGVTTDMEWQAAHVLRGGASVPIPAWTRFKIHFIPPKQK